MTKRRGRDNPEWGNNPFPDPDSRIIRSSSTFRDLVRPPHCDLPSKRPQACAVDRKATRFAVRIHQSQRLKGVEGGAKVTPTTPVRLATCVALAAFGLASCTAVTPSTSPGATSAPTTSSVTPTTAPTPPVTPTPTPTLDVNQAAALAVAEAYEAALGKVRADPAKYDQYKMIDLLKPLALDDMIQANLNGIRSWRDKGWHEEGQQVILRREVGKPDAVSNGTLRVAVTICKDQRELTVVDKKGKKVTAEAALGPDFLENTYDMRRPKGSDSFRVYEFGGEEVDGCSA